MFLTPTEESQPLECFSEWYMAPTVLVNLRKHLLQLSIGCLGDQLLADIGLRPVRVDGGAPWPRNAVQAAW